MSNVSSADKEKAIIQSHVRISEIIFVNAKIGAIKMFLYSSEMAGCEIFPSYVFDMAFLFTQNRIVLESYDCLISF